MGKKRKFEMGRVPTMTKLGARKTINVRGRGNNIKRRALRIDHGNFSWGSESCTAKTRVLDTVYNATNNELVRTKTLVKNPREATLSSARSRLNRRIARLIRRSLISSTV